MKYIFIIAILFSMSSCLKTNKKDETYFKCLINNKKWESSNPVFLFNEKVLEINIMNDTLLTSLRVIGKKFNKNEYNYIDHERVSINILINENIQNLTFPITFSNSDVDGYYRNGFRTEENVQSYSPPTQFHVTDFNSTNVSITLESLTRYESCSNKSSVVNNNGSCFEFTGSFHFTGHNHYNETMEVTNGQFKIKAIANYDYY